MEIIGLLVACTLYTTSKEPQIQVQEVGFKPWQHHNKEVNYGTSIPLFGAQHSIIVTP